MGLEMNQFVQMRVSVFIIFLVFSLRKFRDRVFQKIDIEVTHFVSEAVVVGVEVVVVALKYGALKYI